MIPFAKPNAESLAELGQEMHAWLTEMFPWPRSITGEGLRKTLRFLQGIVPLRIIETPTGSQVLDWVVPEEWVIRDAYIADVSGKRLVDFNCNSLHVVNYSVGVKARLTREELLPRLHVLPDQPDWIPYEKSYYQPTWGFCLSYHALNALGPGPFDVFIDAEWIQGSLSYGELLLPGESQEEILISAHACHPSLANDNLSGLVVAAALARHLMKAPLRLSYRFLFAPGAIGAVTWLAQHDEETANVRAGLVLTCLGDAGKLHYKRSRQGTSGIDIAVAAALKETGKEHQILPFSPTGYDERQFCSPGYNLPVGRLSRTPHGEFAEYHTSADNPDFVKPWALADSWQLVLNVCTILENNRCYRTVVQKGEPQLSRWGVYDALPAGQDRKNVLQAIPWVLNYSDGANDLLTIAELSGLPFATIAVAAAVLVKQKLLYPLEDKASCGSRTAT